MEKNFKEITGKYIPIIATFGSLIAMLWLYKNVMTTGINFDIIEPLIAVVTFVVTLASSFYTLKLFRHKKDGNIFVLYSHNDKKFVIRLVESLKIKRFNVFYDDEVIKIGDNIQKEIIENILKTDLIILILSNNSNNSNFISNELKFAFDNKKKVIPVLIDSNVDLPEEIKQLKYADFTKDYESNFKELIKALTINLEEKSSS